MIGQVIGNYRIVSELGKGGMGVVYRAAHTQLGRPVALKMLLPQLSNDPGIVQRFFNEARAASAIDHPGIVEVYDFGTHTDGRAFIVMALLKGESLEHRLKRIGMAPLEGASVVAQVVGALAAAHAGGIVHRDLKPDNIFLVPNELMPGGIQAKLLDFGIAKLADEQGAGLKTQTGALIGTPAYMSPEQCMGKSDLDHRTDLYAIGCILFHILCGRPPFVSEHGTGMMIAAHLRDTPPDPRSLNPQVPDDLARITLRLLEKDPAARFQSAAELRATLIAAGAAAPTVPPAPVGLATAPGSMFPQQPRFSGPEAYQATTAPTTGRGLPPNSASGTSTTASDSAGQVVTRGGGRGGGRGAWLVVGALLLALTGLGVAVSVTRGGDDPKPGPIASGPVTPTTPATPTTPLTSNTVVTPTTPMPLPEPGKPSEPTEPVVPAANLAACPPGQTRTDDTRDHCCWPTQAWSSAKDKCVGKPVCPKGFKAHGEQCEEIVLEAPIDPNAPTPLARQNFAVSSHQLSRGDKITVQFVEPLRAANGERFWITVAGASTADSTWGAWKYVPDAAKSIVLDVPGPPGDYEVRLHANYPKRSNNVVHRVAITLNP